MFNSCLCNYCGVTNIRRKYNRNQTGIKMDRIAKLKEYLAATPQDSFLQHALALEYIKSGNEDEARVLLETLLERDEDYIGSYYHLAQLLQRQGKGAEAIRWYEKGMAKAKASSDMHAYNELLAAYEDFTG